MRRVASILDRRLLHAANVPFLLCRSFSSAASDEAERELEEEEFRAMDAAWEETEFLPMTYRIAAKADALDAELQRLSYVLFEKPQLVADMYASTRSGRPASVLTVLTYDNQLDNHSDNKNDRPRMSKTAVPPTGNCVHYCPLKWSKPKGSSSPIVQWMGAVRRFIVRGGCDATRVESNALATQTADLDYVRRMKRLHALNYYSRMNMTPKRNVWLATYAVLWNVVIAAQNATGCVIFGAVRGIRDDGLLIGLSKGTFWGTMKAMQFLLYGLILSPLIHLPRGVCNSFLGAKNALTGTLFFEATSGRWQYCSVADIAWLQHDLIVEQRAIRGVGRVEFHRKHMKAEERWRQRLASMGFSFDRLHRGMTSAKGKQTIGGASEVENPYEVLQLKRSASQTQVKAQYKKLAKVFHPDVVQSQSGAPLTEAERCMAQQKFESISDAYQILSNPEKRKSYDLGGAQALRLHESKMGRFMSRTPEEMIQGIYGGEPFRQLLLGTLLRSHWHLRNEAQVSVSLHEFEELQCIRCRHLSLQLAKILDVHATSPLVRSAATHHVRVDAGGDPHTHSNNNIPKSSHRISQSSSATHTSRMKGSASDASPFVLVVGTNDYNCFSRDFEERCERFTRQLTETCFGRELMYTVGQSYIVSSQRFLGIRPFYAPKLHAYKQVFSGIDRVYRAFREKISEGVKNDYEWLAKKVMVEYFSMEFDTVIADSSVILRYAAQNVLQDVAIPEEQRRRRCYAMWYLGEMMVRKGAPWSSSNRDDGELMAYIQQAANSAATTGKPHPF